MSVSALAQNITVKGHVKDNLGEVAGATVVQKGTSNGCVTDFDGNFSLSVPKGATLVVSFVGYLSQEVQAAPNLNITLVEDSKMLNEQVVIGYGTVKKNDMTGAVTAIKPDDKNHGLETNAQDMIQGKIAGVSVISDGGTPGGGATIRIRGGSSLNASNDPLIVIDGLAMDTYGVQGLANPLSMVNPADIESFTVLKDASATAIYGSRASNGVIIITTKKGKAGSKPKISYNGNISVSAKKKTIDLLDGPAYQEYVKNLYGEDSEAYNALGYYDANGNKQYANTNWQDEIYRTAISTDHNITVAGGLKNMPYRVSVGYTNSQGILKTSNFERYTASFNVAPEFLDKHLKMNINGKGMIANNRYADGGAIGAARYMDPTKPVYSDAAESKYFGGYYQWSAAAGFNDPSWTITNNNNATQNPVALLNQKNDHANSKALLGNIELDYAIHGFEDLHLHVNGAMDVSSGRQECEYTTTSYSNNYFGRNSWNTKDTYNLQLSAYAQYMKDFAKIHSINVMAGYEWQKYHQKTDWYAYGTYPTTEYTTAQGTAGKEYNAPTTTTLYKSENYLVSFFGRFNYSLLDRYLFTFTMRSDGSSRFHKDGRWGYFPSAALAWRINEEAFLKNVDCVSDTKLRLGWGVTGQQEGIGDYGYIATYTPNLDHAYYPIIGNGLNYRPDAYNKALTWEKTTTWNAGLDLGFLNNRLTFNLDWYYRKTTDLINDVYVSAGSNFKNKVKSNIGSLHNTGLEFATTIRPIVTKDFTWEVNYNVTYNRSRIDELIAGNSDDYMVPTGGISAGTGGDIQAHAVGHARSAFYVYQQAYDANGKAIPNTYVDRNGDGVVNTKDKYFFYKPDADVTMGLSNKFIYKNWDLGFSMRASFGNYVYNDNQAGACNVGKGSIYQLGYLGNRTEKAVEIGFTNPLTEQFFSDMWIENASFLKMDNITLGYNFDKLFGAKIGGRVYGTVQNVFTITNYSGIDPEVNGGIDNSLYPRPITSIIGLSLNF